MRTKRFTVRPCDEEISRVWDVCENRGGGELVAVATLPTRSAARARAAAWNASGESRPQVSETAPDRRQGNR